MAEWLSDNRANFALIAIIGLLIAFVWSIQIGVQTLRAPVTRCLATLNAPRAAGTGRSAECPPLCWSGSTIPGARRGRSSRRRQRAVPGGED